MKKIDIKDIIKPYISISKFIENTYEFGLSQSIKNGISLCDLSFNYYDGSFPDYSKDYIQQNYLLKYSLAYAFEYSQMYKKIIHEFKKTEYINILSLGCGSCIDYWALCYTLRECHYKFKIKYIGIDNIKWYYNDIENNKSENSDNDYKFYKREEDICYFIKTDIKNLENEIDTNDRHNIINGILSNLDVIIFPRSINEICKEKDNNEAIKNLSKRINNNKLYLLSSVFNNNEDKYLFNEIISIISKALNLKCIKNSDIQSFEKKGIFSLDNNFDYPSSIKLKYESICEYRKNKHEEICNKYNKKCYVNHSPILYADKIKYMYGIIGKEL